MVIPQYRMGAKGLKAKKLFGFLLSASFVIELLSNKKEAFLTPLA
jgi:hypothetical protein